MPDIIMCKGEGCPVKDWCYRHTAEESPLQLYFAVVLYEEENDDCLFFWLDGWGDAVQD